MSIDQVKKSSKSHSISKYIDIIWPIERHELSKFFLTTALMFCILFNQNLIRALKDTIVITNIGAETLSFLKFWGVAPASFGFAAIYIMLVNQMNGRTIFFMIIGFFLSFFTLFGFIILPHHEFYHLSPETAEYLVAQYPHFKWLILLVANWSFSIFYIIAELWSPVVFSLLFWQFANNITTVDESKRFYSLFGLFGQTGLFISGTLLVFVRDISVEMKHRFNLLFDTNIISVQILLTIVLVLGLVAIWIFHNLSAKMPNQQLTFKVKKKDRLSVYESLKLVISSRYIRLIGILLFCYGAAINLVEGPWKGVAAKLYPNMEDYLVFVGGYLQYTGIFVIIFSLIGSNVVRFAGWYYAAIATPIILLVTGLIFFLSSNLNFTDGFAISYFVLTDPLVLAAMVGSIQNALSKSTKYTLFDATKEMAYVPLDNEIKTKGKAAVDVMGIKFGKSSSALFQNMIFTFFPTVTYASSSLSVGLMIIFICVCSLWIWCVRELSNEYSAILKE